MSPNLLIASQLSQHVTPVVPDVVDDLVDDLVDYAASNICVSTNTAVPLMDERERYIDQLMAEIESLQVRLPIHSLLQSDQTFPFLSLVIIRVYLLDKKHFERICVTM